MTAFLKSLSFFSRNHGVWVVLTMLVASDLARVLTPGQPAVLSGVPLALTLMFALGFLLHKSGAPLPTPFKVATGCLLCMLTFGSLAAVINNVPGVQIAAGWLSYAGILPGFVLGHASIHSHKGRTTMALGITLTLCFALAVCWLQETQILSSNLALSGIPDRRGVPGLGQFYYNSGPFRTSDVFGAFLAASALIFIQLHGHTTSSKGLLGVRLVLLISIWAGFMIARRSVLVILLAGVAPYLLLTVRRHTTQFVLTTLAVILFGYLSVQHNVVEGNPAPQVVKKFAHSTVNTNAAQRIKASVKIVPSDWDLVSAFGDGLGSHGASVRALGPQALSTEKKLLQTHPTVHYGWFKDLMCFGPLGAVLHALFFVFLALTLWPRNNSHTKGKASWPARYSTFLYLFTSVALYFFISTSNLDGLTGGMLLGLAVGVGSAYARESVRCDAFSWERVRLGVTNTTSPLSAFQPNHADTREEQTAA